METHSQGMVAPSGTEARVEGGGERAREPWSGPAHGRKGNEWMLLANTEAGKCKKHLVGYTGGWD